jgi:hypothetical protein
MTLDTDQIRSIVIIGLRLLWLASLILAYTLRFVELPVPIALAWAAWGIALLGLTVVAIELVLGLLWLLFGVWYQPTTSQLQPISVPNQKGKRSKTLGYADELYRVLWHATEHKALTWLPLTISAAANQPVSFAVGAGSRNPQTVAETLTHLGKLIRGLRPDSNTHVSSDPLITALRQAPATSVLAWREFGLALPAQHPLHISADSASALIGPLAATLQPSGKVQAAELQLALNPLSYKNTAVGAVKNFYRRQMFSPAPLGKQFYAGLEKKVGGPFYDVTLRAVVIATDQRAAKQQLEHMAQALGQYAAPSKHGTQQWITLNSAVVSLVAAPIKQRLIVPIATLLWVLLLPLWALVSGGLGSAVLGISLSLLAVLGLATLIWQRQTVMRRALDRAPRLRPLQRWLLPLTLWRAPALLSGAELMGLWQIPEPELGPLVQWSANQQLPVPAEALLFDRNNQRRPDSLVLGTTKQADGTRVPVGPNLRDLRAILHITAGMGTGKSRLLANLAQQLLDRGFLLIDGKGDDSGSLTNVVRQLVPLQAEQRVVLLDITDRKWPIAINPLANIDLNAAGGLDQAVARLQSLFARIDPDTWAAAPGMQQYLEMSARLVLLVEPAPTLGAVRRALVDANYRSRLLEACQQRELRSFWLEVFPNSGEAQKSSLTALLRRFDKLLLSDTLRLLLSSPRSTINFNDVFEQQLIVLAPLPHVALGSLAATAAILFFLEFLRAAFQRPGDAQSRSDYPLIVDEFQVLVEQGAVQDVATALSQLRSLGIPAIYAHQSLGQLGELRDLMLVNAANRMILRTQEPDASMYANLYPTAGLTAGDISGQIPDEHQYARFQVNNTPLGPMSITPLPWPTPRKAASKGKTKREWQMIVPADRPGASDADRHFAAFDRKLVEMIYREEFDINRCRSLAAAPDSEWETLNARWSAIAAAQRQYLLIAPNTIPDWNKRIRWLSRLRFARPRLLAEAEALRSSGM